MDTDSFAQMADATEGVVALVAGFKAKMIDAGFSVKIAEAAALEFWKMLIANSAK